MTVHAGQGRRYPSVPGPRPCPLPTERHQRPCRRRAPSRTGSTRACIQRPIGPQQPRHDESREQPPTTASKSERPPCNGSRTRATSPGGGRIDSAYPSRPPITAPGQGRDHHVTVIGARMVRFVLVRIIAGIVGPAWTSTGVRRAIRAATTRLVKMTTAAPSTARQDHRDDEQVSR